MIWDQLKHFKRTEAWGQPEAMNGMLLLLMDAIADQAAVPVIIHCGYEMSGHAKNSQHKTGGAVDFHLKANQPFIQQIELIERILCELQVSKYVGLGIYPDWNNPGFHLDVRGTMARWGAINRKNPETGKTEQVYKAHEAVKNVIRGSAAI